MYTHIFSWRGERVRMVYSVERTRLGLQLVVDDVVARSPDVVNSVPDWLIEYEATETAVAHGARYH